MATLREKSLLARELSVKIQSVDQSRFILMDEFN